MNKNTTIALIVVVALAIIGAGGYFIHHLMTGQMQM